MLCQAPLEVNKYYPQYELGPPTQPQCREDYQNKILTSQIDKVRELNQCIEDLSRENQDLKMQNKELLIRLENWKDALFSDLNEKTVQINKDTYELKVKGQPRPQFIPNYGHLTEPDKIIQTLRRELVQEREQNQSLQKTLRNYEKELATEISTKKILTGAPHMDRRDLLRIPQPLYHRQIEHPKDDPSYRFSSQEASPFRNLHQKPLEYARDVRIEAQEKKQESEFQQYVQEKEKEFERKNAFAGQMNTSYFFVNNHEEVDIRKQLDHYEKQNEMFYDPINEERRRIDYDKKQNIQRYYSPPPLEQLRHATPVCSFGGPYRPLQPIISSTHAYNQQDVRKVMYSPKKDLHKMIESNKELNDTALKKCWRLANDIPDIQSTQRKTFY